MATKKRQRIYKMKGCSKERIHIKGGYTNINGIDKTMPNTGPPVGMPTMATNQMSGGCGTCMRGGGCVTCGSLFGGGKHRVGCRCSLCKKKQMNGGSTNTLIPLNNYHTDIQTSIMPTRGGRRSNMVTRKRSLKGGTLSNFLGQDLINLGRQFQFGVGSAYNGLSGINAPINPLPWKDQFTHTNNSRIL